MKKPHSQFMSFRHPNLELFKGDACDVESFASVLVGKDAVMSCLGVVASIFNPTTFYSESLHALLEGMKRYCTEDKLQDTGPFFTPTIFTRLSTALE